MAESVVHLIEGFGAKCGVCVCWPVVNGPLLSTGREGERVVNCPDCLAMAEPAAPAGPGNPPRLALRCRWRSGCDARQVERIKEDQE